MTHLPRGRAMRILIIEDSEMNRDMLSRRLARRGHQVLTAATGGEGISAAGRERPDVILMDVGLPDMSGIEAVAHLKREAATAAIPVVAVTANTLPEIETACREAGCVGFIGKPIDFGALLGMIQAGS